MKYLTVPWQNLPTNRRFLGARKKVSVDNLHKWGKVHLPIYQPIRWWWWWWWWWCCCCCCWSFCFPCPLSIHLTQKKPHHRKPPKGTPPVHDHPDHHDHHPSWTLQCQPPNTTRQRFFGAQKRGPFGWKGICFIFQPLIFRGYLRFFGGGIRYIGR